MALDDFSFPTLRSVLNYTKTRDPVEERQSFSDADAKTNESIRTTGTLPFILNPTSFLDPSQNIVQNVGVPTPSQSQYGSQLVNDMLSSTGLDVQALSRILLAGLISNIFRGTP